MFKVLVADDEPIARDMLKFLLRTQTDVSEILEAKDGNQALEFAHRYEPDIIFLDIQMPGKSGVHLAEHLPPRCIVIFVTAYDSYAVEAFKLCAIDYLLKPFPDHRFYNALDKAKKRCLGQYQEDNTQTNQLLGHLTEEKALKFKNRLIIKEPGKIRFIEVKKINYVTGAGNYVELHLLDGSSILHRETMTNLETKLDPNNFIRLHRSSLVRTTSISELKPNDNGDFTVVLKTGDTLPLSRRNKSKLAKLIG